MDAFLIYIIKSSFCLLIFYLAYKILFSYETFFRFNRKVLMTGTVICFLLPSVPVKVKHPGFIHQQFLNLEKTFIAETIDFTVSSALIPVDKPDMSGEAVSQSRLVRMVYLSGLSITFIFLLQSVLSLYLLIKKGRRIRIKNYSIIILNRSLAPFNWWKYIVISERDFHENQREIISHEIAHLKKRHSLDLLFMECVILMQWYNPASWLLKRELQEIHEYEADAEVLKEGIDATKYQLLLVKKAVGSSSYTFANSFNQSKLKKRITMMCKVKSSKRNRWKLVLMIPVMASVMYAFARPDVNRQLENLLPGEDTTIRAENEEFNLQFFQQKLNSYLETVAVDQSMTYEKKIEWLDKNSHMITLFVNKLDAVLLREEMTTLEHLASDLKDVLKSVQKDDKPILIFFMHDRATSKEAIQSIMNTVGEISLTYTDQDFFLRMGEVKEFSKGEKKYYWRVKNPDDNGGDVKYKDIGTKDKDDSAKVTIEPLEPDVQLGFMSGNKTKAELIIRHSDTREEIRRKVSDLDLSNITTVSIKAKSDTYMGFITDIKQIIREVSEFKKVSYSTM